MKKLIYPTIIVTSIASNQVWANDNHIFQQFDNQVGVGISYQQSYAYNPQKMGSEVTTTTSNLNLYFERLFNNNLWFNLDGSFVASAQQTKPGGLGFAINTQSLGFPASVNGKVGYSLNWPQLGLQVIPYASLGRNLNYNGMSIYYNGIVSSYLNSMGGGARIEYIILPQLSVYFDQGIAYLQDPNSGNKSQSSASFTSNLGLRYNVTSSFQIGATAMFNQTNLLDSSLGFDQANLSYQNTAQTSWGGMLNFAYLYEAANSSNN